MNPSKSNGADVDRFIYLVCTSYRRIVPHVFPQGIKHCFWRSSPTLYKFAGAH